MSVPEPLAKPFSQYRRILNHQNDSVMQRALAGWIVDGGFERHLNRMRRVYGKRLVVLEDSMRQLQTAGKEISWASPAGGMALWVNFHQNSSRLATAARRRGIFFTPESYYRADGAAGSHARMGFSNLTEDEIHAGIVEIGKLL